jgi:AcrR family transcriptional regulator
LTAFGVNVSVTNMKKAEPTRKPRYRSELRQEQAELTREKIRAATAAILRESGGAEAITFKAVANRAAVTEMTVYRHFPTRAALLEGLWEHMNREMGPNIGMPVSVEALLDQHAELFAGFDRIPEQITASISTAQGREMRSALNTKRRKAFLAIVEDISPRLAADEKIRVAAILQLLHSAYAWSSLREQWRLTGEEAGAATRWAMETLIKNLRRKP